MEVSTLLDRNTTTRQTALQKTNSTVHNMEGMVRLMINMVVEVLSDAVLWAPWEFSPLVAVQNHHLHHHVITILHLTIPKIATKFRKLNVTGINLLPVETIVVSKILIIFHFLSIREELYIEEVNKFFLFCLHLYIYQIAFYHFVTDENITRDNILCSSTFQFYKSHYTVNNFWPFKMYFYPI